jgi:hypothetical protein
MEEQQTSYITTELKWFQEGKSCGNSQMMQKNQEHKTTCWI